MKKASKFAKWTIIICVIAIAVLLSFQIYNYFFASVKTEYAVKASMEDTFSVDGVFCRNETPLKKTAIGYYDIIRTDGEKVSNGGTVACVYDNESDVKLQERVRNIQTEIDEYNAALTAKSSYSGDSAAYDQSIEDSVYSLFDGLLENDATSASKAADEFKKSIIIKEIVSGENTDFEQKIQQLETEKNELLSRFSGKVSYVTADRAGYYSKYADGFESKLMLDSLNEYSVSDFKSLYMKLSEDTGETSEHFGKLISDYKWQFYFVTSNQNVDGYSVGKKISLRFSSVSDQIVSATVIVKKVERDNALIGLECASIQPELLSSRILSADIITKTYSGIRVNKNSLRIVEDKNGVYVKVGSIVKFKTVNVLYIGKTYALVEANTSNGISNFDEIITNGKNLYDGKVLS